MMRKRAADSGRRMRKKNDSLDRYREKLGEINERLVRKAVERILEMGGAPSFSLVSRLTRDLADREKGEKGLTAAAISKNPVYREIVQTAQRSASKERKPGSSGPRMSEGDARMLLHELRIENAKLKRENRILADRLAMRPAPQSVASEVPEKLVADLREMRGIAKSVVQRLMEEELAYIDEAGNLILALYETPLAKREAMEIVFGEELEKLRKKGNG